MPQRFANYVAGKTIVREGGIEVSFLHDAFAMRGNWRNDVGKPIHHKVPHERRPIHWHYDAPRPSFPRCTKLMPK